MLANWEMEWESLQPYEKMIFDESYKILAGPLFDEAEADVKLLNLDLDRTGDHYDGWAIIVVSGTMTGVSNARTEWHAILDTAQYAPVYAL